MSSMETKKGTTPPSAAPATTKASSCKKCNIMTDVFLRVLLLAASIVAVVVMVTSKQTEMIPVPNSPVPGLTVPIPAKFNHSPAFIYFVVALSIAGLYSIITGVASLACLRKPNFQAKMLLILLTHDVLILGIVAAATGTAGGVGYIGLKGNTHVQWGEICNTYDKFCRHVGSSIAVSLFASVVLVVLVFLNAISLYRRIPGCSTTC